MKTVSGTTNFEMDALPLIESLSNNTALRVEQEIYECDFEYALFVCIRDKMCSKGQYCEWIRIIWTNFKKRTSLEMMVVSGSR